MVIATVISIISLIFHFVPLSNTLSAEEIYNKCLYNVVEVKAESENAGESFGTAEIISDSGKYAMLPLLFPKICCAYFREHCYASAPRYKFNK